MPPDPIHTTDPDPDGICDECGGEENVGWDDEASRLLCTYCRSWLRGFPP